MNYSSPLLTDFYQLTMAYGYWKLGMHEQTATFHLLFRSNPFKGQYTLTCGLETVIDFLQQWQFDASDLSYLETLKNAHNERLFPNDFLDYLATLRFSCDLDAILEGTLVFPNEPLLRIEGPLLQCQLLESPLLNIINFQTLIATKASRVCEAAGNDPVIEFGMRRAQGPDGALSASRAAYIGGCVATSNTLAGKLYNIPVRGTHAHSWVTAFPNERDAFAAYASIMPHNCVLLVDTYQTVQGVANAIEVGKQLREKGADLLAIRLDSGDLADLSIKARKMLDDAGFTETGILASNALDEYVIQSLKQQGAKISSWGVGTNLTTAYDTPALDGVYKLSALKNQQGEWEYKLKLSEQAIKISNPGRHQVRRYFSKNMPIGDIVYDINLGIPETADAILFDKQSTHKQFDNADSVADLLSPIFRAGKLVMPKRSIHDIRKAAINAYQDFYRTTLTKDYSYAVGLEKKLYELKQGLIKDLRYHDVK